MLNSLIPVLLCNTPHLRLNRMRAPYFVIMEWRGKSYNSVEPQSSKICKMHVGHTNYQSQDKAAVALSEELDVIPSWLSSLQVIIKTQGPAANHSLSPSLPRLHPLGCYNLLCRRRKKNRYGDWRQSIQPSSFKSYCNSRLQFCNCDVICAHFYREWQPPLHLHLSGRCQSDDKAIIIWCSSLPMSLNCVVIAWLSRTTIKPRVESLAWSCLPRPAAVGFGMWCQCEVGPFNVMQFLFAWSSLPWSR